MRMEPSRSERAGNFCVSATRQGREIAPLIEALRRHIGRIEQAHAQFEKTRSRGQPWMLGVPEIDSHLPAQGLLRAGLHDVSPRAYGDQPAAMGFALALALRRFTDTQERRPLLWCRLAKTEREYGRLYGHGLERLGLPRQRFITVTLKKPAGLLWVMEEALKSGAMAMVMGDAEAAHADLTVTRRLSLAAHAGKSAGCLVFGTGDAATTASHTRWRAASAASQSPPHDSAAPGPPAWSIELTRARGGRPGAWILEWHHAPHRFSLVSRLRGGAVHPWTDEAGPDSAAKGPALRAG
jgi:protein ImuA